MLAKSFRLPHRAFALAKKTGTSWRSADLSLVVASNTLDHARFAVVTSSKLSKRAVVRNRLRRQIYDVLGTKACGQHDILVLPRSSMLNLSHAEVGIKLDTLLSKIPQLA